ncbi:MAG: hypothetical protein V2A79_04030, partial [Planctomycetota bacterium]
MADSFFDVFFEVVLPGGTRAYNHSALHIAATIACVPPETRYLHPTECVGLYTSPTGGTWVANLVSADHRTFPEHGACCNQATSICTDDVDPPDCPAPWRFVEATDCAALDPLCGYGACCLGLAFGDDDNCTVMTAANCATTNGLWKGGQTCQDANCPPRNDLCADLLEYYQYLGYPGIPVGLPQTYTGRNNGATADCAAVGKAVWEAVTLTGSCTDLTVDYCGTDPLFFANATPYLMPNCCDGYADRLEYTVASTTDRTLGDPATCCLDDPPGYDRNFKVLFENVPSGTWYIPVLTQPGSTGYYTMHVTGTACEIGDPAEEDCNGNGTHDVVDIETHASADCNTNWIPDECECDINGDGFGGREDYKQFQICMDTWNEANCACILDHDVAGDVDLKDFVWFKDCFDGCVCCSNVVHVENEPNCGMPDSHNGGCLMEHAVFEKDLSPGETVCGTFASELTLRDTDWYQVDLTTTTKITWSMTAE